jgi:long-chain fatty acid transport protein
VGAQYKATDKVALRIGYNYGENPVQEHDGWNPQGVTMVQGKAVPTFGYELLRNVGFPAIVESHLTLGLGYQWTETMSLNLEYMHAFENTAGSTSAGGFIRMESDLEEDSLGFSLAWQFE